MCDIWIVQAFELLIAHEPGLVGTYASGNESEQVYRASGLASEILLTNAISISRELELEKSIYKLRKHLTCRDGSMQERQISDLLNASSLWLNLRVWEGHYVFFRPTNRVLLDLDDLARAATCMIAVNEYGNKLETAPSNSDGAVPGSDSDSDPDSVHRNKAEKLRSAGRTILAHRVRAMAITHGALSKITDILASARGKNNSTSPNMSSNAKEHTSTSLQVRNDIINAIRCALREQSVIARSMQADMVHFTMIESARLAEEWVSMELNSILAMLCNVGSFCLFTGQIDANFTSRSFMDGLRDDKGLRDGVSELGKGRLELSERLVSSFAFFNRRQINSATATDVRKKIDGVVELTGAPYFLTCAFIVDSCRFFLEGTAFVLVAHYDIQQNFDARVMSMIQAAQRLEEIDSNRYCQADDCGTDEQERSTKPPLSICQLGSKLIRDMVTTMQKWRLDYSMHRMHRDSDVKKIWKENTASGPLPETCDSESHNTLGCAAHHAETQPNCSPNVSPPRTRPTTQFAAANSEYPATAGPLGTYETNAPSPGGYSQTFFTDYLYAAYPQPGFTYPTQLWQPETGNARNFGSMEYLLSGAFPVGAASDVGGMFDASFFDTYPNPFFQQ
ncbi:hypothetical protein BGX21_003216 [Mortierella sp. AD011]|nr:hypothetical protein BGX21_003216 [Mortierella sp. AD011]